MTTMMMGVFTRRHEKKDTFMNFGKEKMAKRSRK
jgi:hypothetical protein